MTEAKPRKRYVNREAWLTAAAERLNEMIAEHTDLTPSSSVQVSVGWPRQDRGGKVIGQCWTSGTGSGTHHVFVSPLLGSATEVLPVLLHELIHAADNVEHGHAGPFRKAWKALGFAGKPTTSVPGKELKATLRALAGELGAFPHKKMVVSAAPKKQVARQLKIECPSCGCVARMTRMWLNDAGAPLCGHCNVRMEEV